MKLDNPMNLDIYDSIHRSVDGIIAYLDQESDVVQGLDKLYNGGWGFWYTTFGCQVQIGHKTSELLLLLIWGIYFDFEGHFEIWGINVDCASLMYLIILHAPNHI